MKGKRGSVSFTTGEVAERCRVTKRTVIKWIDGGRLKGYLIPGSTHRRVAARTLADDLAARLATTPTGEAVGSVVAGSPAVVALPATDSNDQGWSP